MSLQDLTSTLSGRAAQAEKLEAKVKFDLGDDGIIVWDGTGDTPVVDNADGADVDTTLTMTSETLGEILEGETDPTTAFMSGQLTIDGSMEVAMKLSDMLVDE